MYKTIINSEGKRPTQITGRIGEHLVAAKLGRMGYFATPFAGNVPLFDIIAADERGHSIPIQVKAINRGDFQYGAKSLLNIDVVRKRQKVRGKKRLPNPDLVCIYVFLHEDKPDVFYIFRLRYLQNWTFKRYKKDHDNRIRKSFHCAISPKYLEKFKDNWKLIEDSFKEV
jgi:hypothetical protein